MQRLEQFRAQSDDEDKSFKTMYREKLLSLKTVLAYVTLDVTMNNNLRWTINVSQVESIKYSAQNCFTNSPEYYLRSLQCANRKATKENPCHAITRCFPV